MKKLLTLLAVITAVSCVDRTTSPLTIKSQQVPQNYDDSLNKMENESTGLNYDSLGELVSTIRFDIKTNDRQNYKDGKIPYIRIDSPQVDIKNLIGKDDVVIAQTTVTVVLDYPLSGGFKFQLTSQNGFSRAMLINEISKLYYRVYDEEENSATIKTIPQKDRKIYNRNQTNGKYGIWGHDIGDLVLDEVDVYQNKSGEIILTLQIES